MPQPAASSSPGSASRVALLVLAHEARPLQYLLDVLNPRFTVFIHFDAKSDLAHAPLRLPPHARLIAPRLPVFWGGWSMMQATLALIETALAAGPFERLALISGDSLPVRPADALEAALCQPGVEHIEMLDVQDDLTLAGAPMQTAIDRYGWVQPWRFHNAVHWDHVLLNPIGAEAAAAQFGVPRARMDWIRGEAQAAVAQVLAALPPRPPLFRRFCYGAQWWALSRPLLQALLPTLRRPEVHAWFRHMQVPDEHMIQTVLGNRPDLRGGRVFAGTPVFADHARRAAGRDTLDDAGFRAAAQSGAQILFARKFRPADAPAVATAIAAGRYEADILAG